MAPRANRCFASGNLEAAATAQAHPVPWPPCGQCAGSTGRALWPAASSRAEAAAVTPPPGRGCETGRASPHRARAPGVGASAALGDGPAAGAPRLLGLGAVRGPTGEGKRPRRGGDQGAAGAMEGVLYKWTNYLSGEWGARQTPGPLFERPEGGVGTRILGVGVTVPSETREACTGREYFPKAILTGPCHPCCTDTAPRWGWVRAVAALSLQGKEATRY